MWKGKADIINHGEKLVVDLKTTNDLKNLDMLHQNIITILRHIFIVNYLDMKWFLSL